MVYIFSNDVVFVLDKSTNPKGALNSNKNLEAVPQILEFPYKV